MEKKEENFLVENQDLIGAINSALSRGQDLKDAMMSLYNAGYEKQKIEEAAKAHIELSRNPTRMQAQQKKVDRKTLKKEGKKGAPIPLKKGKKLKEKEKPTEMKGKKPGILDKALGKKTVLAAGGVVKKEQKKKVSSYGIKEHKIKSSKAHNTSNLITFLLIFLLILLVVVLGAVFLFKAELVEFFNRLFG
jgi:hypothetical protein